MHKACVSSEKLARAAMMRVSDRNREGVGGVVRFRSRLRQQMTKHGPDLRLFGVPCAGYGFLNRIWSIFRDAQPKAGGSKKRNSSRLTELQGGTRVAVHKCFLYRRFVRSPLLQHLLKSLKKPCEPFMDRAVGPRYDCAASDKRQPRAVPIHNAPTHIAKAWVKANDAYSGAGHCADVRFVQEDANALADEGVCVAGCGQAAGFEKKRFATARKRA